MVDLIMTYRPYTALTTSGISDLRINASGSTITKGTPVRISSGGDVDFVNVSVEAQALAVAGIAAADIPDMSSGAIITNGKVDNITTSAVFGDFMYVDKAGLLTNVKPSIGINSFVAGDFVISVGVIAKNSSNPVNKDLVISVDIIGQL
jgi:hypothetical protein